ncbi:hypothetical protein HZ326_20623 [Fusarium oxysporum f. sp. albedinis]|nr:hypothetical protein HZ326_20623 [Fusarium oxysporum f. sp. albedinis]
MTMLSKLHDSPAKWKQCKEVQIQPSLPGAPFVYPSTRPVSHGSTPNPMESSDIMLPSPPLPAFSLL